MEAMRYYDFSLVANGVQMLTVSGKNFRIQSQTGALDVTIDSVGTLPGLLTGQGVKDIPFTRLTLRDASGAPNVGQILVAPEEFIDNRTYGVSTIAGGSLDLNAATLLTSRTPLDISGSYNASGAVAANTAVQIFAPGANVNGAILLSAQITDIDATARSAKLLAKNSAPATELDGIPLLHCGYFGAAGASVYITRGDISTPQYIAAGLGLYFISTPGASATNSRVARYRLL